MKYCQNCILPDTRPNLVIRDDGICNACKSHKTKKIINWQKREEAFGRVVENAKMHSQGYECLLSWGSLPVGRLNTILLVCLRLVCVFLERCPVRRFVSGVGSIR